MKKREARNYRHGDSFARTYVSYTAMLSRCNNPNNIAYPRYGGRGVVVCPRWLGRDGYINFKKDMGERPEGKTLDKDIRGSGEKKLYSPETCCWATRGEQQRSLCTCLKKEDVMPLVEMKNQGMTLREIAKRIGISKSTVQYRLKKAEHLQ
jgi:hypothetical protein